MENLPIHSDQTPQRILDAAYILFCTQGYAGTSMRQIADGSKLAVSGIYNHFASKEQIFSAVIEARHPIVRMIPEFSKIQASDMDDFTRKCAKGMVREFESNPEFLNLLLIELIEFKGKHAASLLHRVQPELFGLSKKFSEYGGHIKNIPPVLLLRVFIGSMVAYFFTEMLLKDYISPEVEASSLDTFINVFLNGIKSDTIHPIKEGK